MFKLIDILLLKAKKNLLIRRLYSNITHIIYKLKFYRNFFLINQGYVSYKKLISFKNLHKGESCLIVGNGPSLTPSDLEKLKHLKSFGSNHIYKIFDRVTWRPDYYFAIDIDLLTNDNVLIQSIKDFIEPERTEVFLPINIFSPKKFRLLPLTKVNYFRLKPPKEYTCRFSLDLNRYAQDGWSVSYTMLQAAVYMGFDNIYLIGMDNSHLNNGTANHFYSEKSEVKSIPHRRVEASFDYSNSYLTNVRPNLRIINITRGGYLEVFERQTIETLI